MSFKGKPKYEYHRELKELAMSEQIKPKPMPQNRAIIYDINFDPPTAYEVFAKGLDVPSVCVALSIARTTYYAWLEKYPEFADACARGKEAAEAYWDERADKHVVLVTEKDGPKVTFNTDLHKFVKKTVYKAKEADPSITNYFIGADADKAKLDEIDRQVAERQAEKLKDE